MIVINDVGMLLLCLRAGKIIHYMIWLGGHVMMLVCCCAGKIIHYMTGHMDSVTGLAIDQLGQHLLSGGKCEAGRPSLYPALEGMLYRTC